MSNRANPLTRYFRARIHRRILLNFLVSIAFTALTVYGVTRLIDRVQTGSFGTQHLDHFRTFLGNRFAMVWNDPTRREELVSALSTDLGLEVTLSDAQGNVVYSKGPPCAHGPSASVVNSSGVRLGTVRACSDHPHTPSWVRTSASMAVAVIALWIVTGLLSRRLSRPLEELAWAAEQIGTGRLGPLRRLGGDAPYEVRLVSQVMDGMAGRIRKQLEDQRALLATVSHEMRTPLARLRLLVEMVRSRYGEDADFDKLDREVADMDALVSDLLASSRVDFSAVSPSMLDASCLAKDELTQAEVDPSVLDVAEPGLSFLGDPTLTRRAVGNLIANAKLHGGGVVALRVASTDDRRAVGFEVDDAGPGFKEGEEERIFEPFHRQETLTDSSGAAVTKSDRSVGLGLSLVRRIAEAHGGRAYARNRTGGGATVGVTFAVDVAWSSDRAPRASG